MNGNIGGFGLWFALLIVIAIIALGLVTYAFIAWHHMGSDGRNGTSGDPLSTLRSRYARGELSDEEFEEKRSRLEETE